MSTVLIHVRHKAGMMIALTCPKDQVLLLRAATINFNYTSSKWCSTSSLRSWFSTYLLNLICELVLFGGRSKCVCNSKRSINQRKEIEIFSWYLFCWQYKYETKKSHLNKFEFKVRQEVYKITIIIQPPLYVCTNSMYVLCLIFRLGLLLASFGLPL